MKNTGRLMDEMEYVKYYCDHLLETAVIDGEEYVFNDISRVDDKIVEENAKKLGIKKDVFVDEVSKRYNSQTKPLNYDALWKLSLYLYQYIYLTPVIYTEYGMVDEYMELFTLIAKKGLKKIQFYPSINDDKGKVTIKDEKLVDMIATYIINEHNKILTEDSLNNYDFDISKIKASKDIDNMSTLKYAFIQELTNFFTQKFGIFTSSMKVVIMAILIVFNKESFIKKERVKISDDNKKIDRDSDDTLDMKYNRIMSDAKKDRLIKTLYSHEIGILNKEPMPFAFMPNPKSHKTRYEYFELLKKYRKEKDK